MAEESHDPRSTSELVNIVLTNDDEHAVDSAYWNAMRALHQRATLDVFEAARSLCESDCAFEQAIGCAILSQLGVPDMPFAAASLPLVASVLRATHDIDTLAHALCALGWLRDPRGVNLVLPYVDHANAEVRYLVTKSLVALQEDQRCIDALIRLTTDLHAEIRDWATFGLGSLTDHDSPTIRDALVARLEDVDAIVSGEALIGLARRQDPRVIAPLLQAFESGTYTHGGSDYAREALDELRDVTQYPQLLKWKTNA